MDPAGRVVFITGGAQGIGLGMARAFTRAGARVAIADVDTTALAQAHGELPDAATYELDVQDRAGYAAVTDAVEREVGPVSILCNNAGVLGGVHATKIEASQWDFVIGVNLTGVFNGVAAFLPRFLARREGHVVNTASAAGLAVVDGGAGWLYYTSKFGVVGMSEALRQELAPSGIGVSVLCPGPVATDIVENSIARRPPGFPTPLGEESGMPTPWMSAWLHGGSTPDAVGDLVVEAVRGNQLYVHTDDIMREHVTARAQAIVDAMPSPSAMTPGLRGRQDVGTSSPDR